MKKFLASLLSLCMVFSMIPMTVAAADETVFTDVKAEEWYADEILWCYAQGLMNGTGNNEFSPEETTTRGQIVTILWRQAGQPVAAGAQFDDVAADAYYAPAILWAAQKGIVQGYGAGKFGPEDPITREQLAVILYNFAVQYGYGIEAVADLSAYTDVSAISDWAYLAMCWANRSGLITGVTETTLVPGGEAIRAQVAVILYRFLYQPAEAAETVTVTFVNGEEEETVTVEKGETVEEPGEPGNEDEKLRFFGWYTKQSGGKKFDFGTAITEDITLYARWSTGVAPIHIHKYNDSYVSNGDGTHNTYCECGKFVLEDCVGIAGEDACVCGYEIWDGVINEETTLAINEGAKTVTVSSPDELALLAQTVNAGTTFKDYTVTLTSDLELGMQPWTPIGNSTNNFQGIFDGASHTVSCLNVEGNNSNVGLFGYTTKGEVKNLTVRNAKVSGYLNVGVIAGTPYTSKYTNITVTGHVEVDGYAYVGGVGGKNAYADWTNITVDVDDTSYVKADSENYRTYVGGVVGFMGEGSHTVSNVTSNIDVIGSTCDVGGIAGIGHYNNKFINCHSTGDITVNNDDTEIGGILGVWHNQDGTTVTLTNCSHIGTLSKMGEADFHYNGLVGSKYKETGTGTLIIDGITMIATGVGTDAGGNLAITSAEGLIWFAEQVNSGNNYNGKTVTLANDINLSGQDWTPIGTAANSFNGTFDGKNHDIWYLTAEGDGVGLFGYCWTESVIKNVKLVQTTLTGNHFIGAVVAHTYGDVMACEVFGLTINCEPSGTEGAYDNGDKVGGIAGWASCGTISDCSVSNATMTAYRDVGGIVGASIADNRATTVKNCKVTETTITLDNTKVYDDPSANAGKIVGRYAGSIEEIVSDCTADDDVIVVLPQ